MKRGNWTLLILPALIVIWLVILLVIGLSIEGAEDPEKRFATFLILTGFFSLFITVNAVISKLRGDGK